MHYGVFIFPTDYSIRHRRTGARRGGARLRVLVRDRAHAHSDQPAVTVRGGGPLPKEYAHTLDPFIGLTAAAAVTQTAQAGHWHLSRRGARPHRCSPRRSRVSICLSNGRFLFGIGAGWNAEEMEHHGHVFKTRFRLLRERILAMAGDLDQGGGRVPPASS